MSVLPQAQQHTDERQARTEEPADVGLGTSLDLSAGVREFLPEKHGVLIGGRWTPSSSGETFAVENPANEQTIAHVARGGPADIDRAVKAARKAFAEGAGTGITPSGRGRVIWRGLAGRAGNWRVFYPRFVLDGPMSKSPFGVMRAFGVKRL